jgi:diacylglycerol kinase
MLSFTRFIKSFGYAYQGLSYSFKNNQNIKIHLFFAILVLILALLFGLTKYELLTVGTMIILVLSAEMINSSIEEVVNLMVNEHRQEAKIAKDVSAGMVLMVSLFAAIVGVLIFLPHILTLFS